MRSIYTVPTDPGDGELSCKCCECVSVGGSGCPVPHGVAPEFIFPREEEQTVPGLEKSLKFVA